MAKATSLDGSCDFPFLPPHRGEIDVKQIGFSKKIKVKGEKGVDGGREGGRGGTEEEGRGSEGPL